MAQATVDGPQKVEPVREGSRWLYNKPSGESVGEWFEKNVELHEGLEHEKYIGGIVLIPQQEKVKETRLAANGSTQIVEVEQMVYIPYAKVETRVAYWWDFLDRHPEWVGAIEPVGSLRDGLPPGFFKIVVADKDSKNVAYLGCSVRARILTDVQKASFKQDGLGAERRMPVVQGLVGTPVREYPQGTKLVPMLDRWGKPDPNAFMKAETGAVGRALGMAGMLVIPGSGVATAEDMQESGASMAVEPELPEAATAPAAPEAEVDVRDKINEGLATLETEAPEAFEKVTTWASGRKIDLDDIKETQLRGVLRQVERGLEAAAAADEG